MICDNAYSNNHMILKLGDCYLPFSVPKLNRYGSKSYNDI